MSHLCQETDTPISGDRRSTARGLTFRPHKAGLSSSPAAGALPTPLLVRCGLLKGPGWSSWLFGENTQTEIPWCFFSKILTYVTASSPPPCELPSSLEMKQQRSEATTLRSHRERGSPWRGLSAQNTVRNSHAEPMTSRLAVQIRNLHLCLLISDPSLPLCHVVHGDSHTRGQSHGGERKPWLLRFLDRFEGTADGLDRGEDDSFKDPDSFLIQF